MPRCSVWLRTLSLGLWVVVALSFDRPASAGWGEDTLEKESRYIIDCSYTQYAQNKSTNDWQADAYGALNNVRLASEGATWVVPSEGAVAMIGLMAATRELRNAPGYNVSDAENVMNDFFDNWLKWKRQPIVGSGVDAGGVVDLLEYNATGQRTYVGNANAGSTGIMMVAMYKYYEFLRDTGRATQAQAWLDNPDAWDIMQGGFTFLANNYNTQYKMVHSRSGQNDLWLTDAVLAACGMRCFREWAIKSNRSPGNSLSLSNNIKNGLTNMKDTGGWKNFYRLREANNNYNPGYGDRIDQICHLPYESGLLPANQGFAQQISNWWTNGSAGSPRMTYQTNQSNNWRYYGTRWKYFFSGNPASNDYLYPGPALQLAKMEWRTGKARGKAYLVSRANQRFAFANSNAKANLWFGANGQSEAGVTNGIVDWRDANNYNNKADDYLRFVDTSSYMLQVTLMVIFDQDTVYIPVP